MNFIYILFLGISLGSIATLSAGGINYELKHAELILLVTLASLLLKSVRNKLVFKINETDKVIFWLWFVCFGYSLLAYFWSSEPITSLSGSIVLFFALVTLFVSNYYIYNNPKIFIIGNRILVVSLIIQLMINMAVIFSGNIVGFYAMKEHANTLLGNSNAISFYFSFVLIYEFIAKDKGWFTFATVSALGVVLTISRGAIVSIVASLAVYVVVLLLNKRIKKVAATVSIGALILLFYFFIRYTVPGIQLWESLQAGLQATSVGSRQMLWGQAIDQIRTSFYGNGVVWTNDPHNIILRAIRDFGVVVGPIFLMLISYPFFYFLKPKTYNYSNKPIAVLIAYISVFVHALVEVFYLTSISIVWTIMTLSFLNAVIRKEHIQSYETEPEVKKEDKKKRRFKRYKIVWSKLMQTAR